MAYYLSIAKNKQLFISNKKSIKEIFQSYCENNERFIKSISSNTNNLIETSTRFVLWGKALKKFDKTLSIPSHLNKYFKGIKTS